MNRTIVYQTFFLLLDYAVSQGRRKITITSPVVEVMLVDSNTVTSFVIIVPMQSLVPWFDLNNHQSLPYYRFWIGT